VTLVDARGISSGDVVDLLAASLGTAKAEQVVRGAVASLRLGAGAFQLDQALALLEKIAEEPGIVGITARFAKTRALLRWTP
jgi:hypothetical protein